MVSGPRSTPARRANPGRRRKRVGWALLTLGAVYTAVMIGSLWWWGGYCGATWLADLGDGTLYVDQWIESEQSVAPLLGWSVGRNSLYGARWFVWAQPPSNWSDATGYSVWPAGPAILISALACLWSGWRVSRRRVGMCGLCGYSLRGISASVCPECGHAVDPAAPPAPSVSGDA